MVINLLARIPGLPQRNEDHLPSFPSPRLCQIPVRERRGRRGEGGRGANSEILQKRQGKKCAEGGQVGRALMDVDLRVVAVKLTNRFRGVRPAREGKHVRVIKIHLGQSKGAVEEGGRAEGSGRRRRAGNCS